jgi:hypothetical protein
LQPDACAVLRQQEINFRDQAAAVYKLLSRQTAAEHIVRQRSVTLQQPFRKVDLGNIVTLTPKNGNGI